MAEPSKKKDDVVELIKQYLHITFLEQAGNEKILQLINWDIEEINTLIMDIINKHVTDENADEIFTEISGFEVSNDELGKNDEELFKKIGSIIEVYSNDNELQKSFSNLLGQLMELQIRIILMRCSKTKEVVKSVDAKQMFKDLSDILTNKLKAVNTLYDVKHDNNIIGGSLNKNQLEQKYMKYKAKYMKLKARYV